MGKSSKDKRPGRVPLTKRLKHKCWSKDMQIAALLRGRTMRDRQHKSDVAINGALQTMLTILVQDHGGVLPIDLERIMSKETQEAAGKLVVFEDTEAGVAYIGFEEGIELVLKNREALDCTEDLKVQKDRTYEDQDITGDAIDSEDIRQTYEELSGGVDG